MTAVPASFEMSPGSFPATLDVDPPEMQNRLSVLLRIIYAIPIMLMAAVIGLVAGIMTVIAWFVILFTGKYPAGMATFVANTLGFGARASGYMYLLTDKYPPFSLEGDASYPIRVSITPQIDARNRMTVFFRIIMAIPHLIIISALNYAMEVIGFIAWLIALFTGTIPAGLHNFIAGYVRWSLRANAYVALMTDTYPPFSLN